MFSSPSPLRSFGILKYHSVPTVSIAARSIASGSVGRRSLTSFVMTNPLGVISSGSEKSFSTQKQTMILIEPLPKHLLTAVHLTPYVTLVRQGRIFL
jgi:hypothetical protein